MTYQHKVQYYETDRMGITHHSNYIRWMEEARVDFLEQLGWGYDRLEALGVGSPVLGVACSYKQPTTFHDTVEVTVCLKEYRGARMTIGYEMRDVSSGELRTQAESAHCFLTLDGRPVSLKRSYPEWDKLFRNMSEMEAGKGE